MARALPRMTITLEGKDELLRAFDRLTPVLQRKCLRPALRRAAERLREGVANVARSLLTKSGSPSPHVADTLKIRAYKRDQSKRARLGFMVMTAKKATLRINGQGYYPIHVELGYLAGPAVQGPVQHEGQKMMKFDTAKGDWVTDEQSALRDEKHRFVGRGRRKDAWATFQSSQRRHIPGVHFMKRGLNAMDYATRKAFADELQRRVDAIDKTWADERVPSGDPLGPDDAVDLS